MGRGNPAGSGSRIPTAPGALGAAGPAGLAFLWGFGVFFQSVGELLALLAALLPWAGCRGSHTGLCLHPRLHFWCRQTHEPLSFPPSTALLGGWAGTSGEKVMQASRTRPAPAQHRWGQCARRREIHGNPPRHGGIILGLQAELPAPCPQSRRVPPVPSCPLGDHQSPVPTPVRTRAPGCGGVPGGCERCALASCLALHGHGASPHRAGSDKHLFLRIGPFSLIFFLIWFVFFQNAALPQLRAIPSGPVAAPGHGWAFGSQGTALTEIQPDTEQNPQTFFCGAALIPDVYTHPAIPYGLNVGYL